MACAAGSARKASAVLYHYPCPDGAFAALAAHLYFSAAALPVRFFPNTVYDPIRSDGLPFDEIEDVYLLDFVGPPGFVADIAPKVQSVTILDHHKTAMESLCGSATLGENVNKVIDMQRSGATIAFDYFRNKLLTEASTSRNHGSGNSVTEMKYLPENKLEMVHKLFKFIEDGDLWRWTIPNSKAFSSGLKDLNIEFNVNSNGKLFDQAVNADAISMLRSELGNQLANKSRNSNLRAIGAVVYKVPELNNDEMLKISLRSLEQEDTTSISQEFGGGGHRNASSFLLSVAEFERWKVGAEPSNAETA
uniref:DHHA1 domain-containing protein n=1 Tax=Triticum aestivum TaxID=4565 RepID=A0A3B6QGC4_WHEAT